MKIHQLEKARRMTDKKILIVKPKSLSKIDKQKLSRAGHIVIECDNPLDVRMLESETGIPANEMLKCALAAMAERNDFEINSQFVKRLNKVINPPIKTP